MPVTDARDLARKIGGMPPGTTVKLGVLRKGADKTVSLTLGELPNEREARADAEEQPRKSAATSRGSACRWRPPAGGSEPGVVVAEVDPSGPAADFGFKTGDVILEVGGKRSPRRTKCARRSASARADGKRQRADAREV